MQDTTNHQAGDGLARDIEDGTSLMQDSEYAVYVIRHAKRILSSDEKTYRMVGSPTPEPTLLQGTRLRLRLHGLPLSRGPACVTACAYRWERRLDITFTSPGT